MRSLPLSSSTYFCRATAMRLAREAGLMLEILDETGSTNDDLKALVRCQVQTKPDILLTFHQTGGRGTNGRAWVNPKPSLLFSLAIPLAKGANPALFPLKVGVAVAKALRAKDLPVGLKWPNDLWLYGAKTGGVLCELVKDKAGNAVVVAGVGLNLLGFVSKTTHGWPVTGLFESQAELEPAVISRLFIDVISSILAEVERESGEFCEEWAKFDAFHGDYVHVEGPNQVVGGTVLGINPVGHLRLQTSTGTMALMSGTILPNDPSRRVTNQ